MRIERLEAGAPDTEIDSVVALESESFTNPWSRESLVWELKNSDVTRAYVLRDEAGGVVAFCVSWLIFDELHINTLAVTLSARRQGMATTLLRHVMADAAANGALKATLEVRASNSAAISLYERLGFHVAATRPRYYVKPEEDALILWRDGLDTSP